MFWETPAGQPKALRAWFYPGDNFGQEFQYPEEELQRLAQRPSPTVTVASIQTRTIEQEPQQVAQARPPAPAPEPEPQPAPEPQAQPEPEPAPAPAPVSEPEPTLPRTASPFPLIGLAGLLSIGAGLALHIATRRGA